MKLIYAGVLALALCGVAPCQEFRGTISGVVTDPTGATIPGAKVLATEVRTGTKSPTVADSAGQYAIPFLAPGDYQISATMPGFKEFIRKDIHLGSGDHPVIDMRLDVGDTSQAVEVTADAPLLNTENASLGQAITTKEVEEIPLNGRNPAMLAQFAIGVIPTGTPTLVHPFDSGGPSAFSISGSPSQTNELLLDGSPDATWDGRQAYSPPHDAVQEVRVKAFDSDSSFGHTGGGTLNQVLKTGTNTLHGTLWEFNQPSNLTANDFFRNRSGAGNPVTHYNQYGITAGGPVLIPKVFDTRNKLFWFFAFEGLPDSQPATTFLTVPTDAERKGDFSSLLSAPNGSQYQLYDPNSAVQNGTTITRSPLAGNVIPASRLNPIALNYLKFYPEPNVTVGVSPSGVNNYVNSATTNDKYNNQLGRLDYNMSDKNRVFFDVRRTGYSQIKQNYFNNIAEGISLYRDNWGGTLDDVYMFAPSLVGNARLNFTRMAEGHAVPSQGFDPTTLGFPSYMATSSVFLQLPIQSFSTYQNLGGNSTTSNNYPSQSFQFFGDLVKIKGNHSIKAGTDLRQYRVNVINFGNSTGTFSYGNTWVRSSSSASSNVAQGQDMASFLLGLPTGGSYDLPSNASFYSYFASGFVQDDWRASRTLTINLGLRYDHDGAYHEKWARTVNGFASSTPNPVAAAAQAAYAKNPIPQIPASDFNVLGGLTFASTGNTAVYQNTSHLVSPRVGIAWSPGRLKGTVIRAGFGMFVTPVTIASLSATGNYSTNPIEAQEGFSQTTSMVTTNNNNLTPAATLSNPFPGGIAQPQGSAAGLATFNGQTVNFLNPLMKNPYALNWNIGIQHSFGQNTLMEVVYIGNHSVHLPITVTQLNGIPRQYLSTLPVRDAAENTTLSATVANPFQGLLPNSSNLNGSTVSLAQLLSRYPQYPVGYGSGAWSGSTGVLEMDLDAGSSYFDSLNARVQHRLSKGLTVLGNFMYSRLVEERTWLNDSDGAPEKRISPFDHPLRFVVGISYDLPIGKGKPLAVNSRVLNLIAGGWHVNSFYTWQVGGPLAWMNGSTTTPGDYVFFGGAGALPNSLSNRQANTTALGVAIPAFDTTLFQTNSSNTFAYHLRTFSTTFPNVRADGLNEWDPSMLKNFYIHEKVYFQLRFEVFNVLNHPTFAAPNLQATNAQFGIINAMANRPRTIQVGARFVF